MTPLPLVTCLCLTHHGRNAFLRRAIACWAAQTYERRDLLIVADGASDLEGCETRDPRIGISFAPAGMNVGEKRNWGCRSAAGSLIAHWDSDDYSGPERLADQVFRLRGPEDLEYSVTGYHSMPYTDGVHWWMYEGRPFTALGTSLLYRRDWWAAHCFQGRQLGEDLLFIQEAVRGNQFIGAEARDLMFARIHQGNTDVKPVGTDANYRLIAEPTAFARVAA